MARYRSSIAIGATLLAACGSGEYADLQGFVGDPHDELRGRVEPAPQVAAAEPFAYEVTDVPDPFAAQRVVPRNADPGLPTPRRPGPHEPLAAYPLESLAMVGTLTRGGQRWALIRTPENAIYRVARGSFMGQQLGEVAAISEASVTLHEYVQDTVTGQWSERVSNLLLQDGERG